MDQSKSHQTTQTKPLFLNESEPHIRNIPFFNGSKHESLSLISTCYPRAHTPIQTNMYVCMYVTTNSTPPKSRTISICFYLSYPSHFHFFLTYESFLNHHRVLLLG
ncbi:hypothetical protein QVD17_18322 [Tagetes erecta]|uniref:Uncharacterized protein n=1 Tax=Tagetes erecta TaxID=13708 RepID=A0AAD8KHC8_TARER|nr:hypothetical protein QVD17_18322 [Tagetes erecta]